MALLKTCKLFEKSIKAFTLIESLISLTIITAIFSIALISYSNLINPKHELMQLKAFITMERIKVEIMKEDLPLELIIEKEKSVALQIDYDLSKLPNSLYQLKIRISSNTNKELISELIILRNYDI